MARRTDEEQRLKEDEVKATYRADRSRSLRSLCAQFAMHKRTVRKCMDEVEQEGKPGANAAVEPVEPAAQPEPPPAPPVEVLEPSQEKIPRRPLREYSARRREPGGMSLSPDKLDKGEEGGDPAPMVKLALEEHFAAVQGLSLEDLVDRAVLRTASVCEMLHNYQVRLTAAGAFGPVEMSDQGRLSMMVDAQERMLATLDRYQKIKERQGQLVPGWLHSDLMEDVVRTAAQVEGWGRKEVLIFMRRLRGHLAIRYAGPAPAKQMAIGMNELAIQRAFDVVFEAEKK